VVEPDGRRDLLLVDLSFNLSAVFLVYKSLHLDSLLQKRIPFIVFDVLHAFVAYSAGGEAVLDVLLGWLHDAVGGKKNWTWEARKFRLLELPGVSIVCYQTLIFLEFWVDEAWKHFTMRVHIDSLWLALFQ
jgi:hypothetical protein